MLRLEFIVVTSTVDIVQWYSVVCGIYCGYCTSSYSAMLLCLCGVFVVTATVDIVQWYCVVCGDLSGYSSSRFSAMVLCFEWSLLWLQQQ